VIVPISLKANTRRAALKEAVALMKAAGLDTPVLDARLIVQHALGVGWESLFLHEDRPLLDEERVRLEEQLGRRAGHEPVSRIVGRRHFWTLELAVSPDTLDPRADTETLIEAAVAIFPDRGRALRVLDLGAGTGALLLALLTEYPSASGLGVDRSPGAVTVAQANARNHGLEERAVFRLGDWGAGVEGSFDLIVSNPPYIRRGDLDRLPPDVRDYDPVLALDGGADGLDAYRALCPAIAALLAPEGRAILEIGAGQASSVGAIAAENGLTLTARRSDLGGVERALSFARVKI
jgi:release factor glutamine methyltransferase